MNLRFPPVRRTCLFCKSEDRDRFTSEEHVFPESLGNKTIILPPGVVCDVCNQYFSKLENQFIHSYPMLFGRFLSPEPTKKGKWPKTELPKGGFIRGIRVSHDPVPIVQIQLNGVNPEERARLEAQYRSHALEHTLPSIRLPEEDIQVSSRVLAKIALELMYLHSPRFAFHHAFDRIRHFSRQARRNEHLPYAWSSYIGGVPFLHCPLMARSAAGACVSMFVFFTIPGARYLVPVAPPCISPSLSILADWIGLKIQTRKERSKPSYLSLNFKSACLP